MRIVVLHGVAIQLPIHGFLDWLYFLEPCSGRPTLCSPVPVISTREIGNDSPSLTCTFTRSNLGCDDLVRNLAPRALLQPLLGLEQLVPPSGLASGSHPCTTHGAFVCTSSPATFCFSHASTAPCLCHLCGITSSTFSHYRQEKCQYCFGGNGKILLLQIFMMCFFS